MDNRYDVPWEGKHVSFRLQSDGVKFVTSYARYHDGHPTCPMCKDLITAGSVELRGGSIWLMISNQVGIPNRIIHHTCFFVVTPEYALSRIADDWKQAQAFKDWFPNP